ncbi:MAG: bifunctional hydroxymethylpyrimidine kinase/phosphomethylpyrimidine kinase [Pontiellaceae bacterium]
MSVKQHIAWTIAGSDSGGGAGIQADLQVFRAFGLHGCSITTAITAQNTQGVQSVEPVSNPLIQAQWNSLINDLPPAIIKSGMLAYAVETVADLLASHPTIPYICDPVLRSSSGTALLSEAALSILQKRIIPRAMLLIPNLPEARELTGLPNASPQDLANALLEIGAQAVLLKGGHADGNHCCDLFMDSSHCFLMESPRISTHATHGTGCVFASATAAAFARGESLPQAVQTAKTYLNQNLKEARGLGVGKGPLPFFSPCNAEPDQPNIIENSFNNGVK